MLCNLQLNNYDKVQEDYTFLWPFIKVKEGQQMCKYIFGIILLPVEDNRKYLIDAIEGLHDIMQFFEKPAKSTLIYKHHYDLADGWNPKRQLESAKALKSLSFFKRFSIEILIDFLPKIKVDILAKDNLLFLNKRTLSTSQDDLDFSKEHQISVERQSFTQRHLQQKSRKVYIIISG
jgi:hypothetical protein